MQVMLCYLASWKISSSYFLIVKKLGVFNLFVLKRFISCISH